MKKNPKIVMMSLTDLKAYDNNPRKNDAAVDAVANSIREFGFKVPVIIDSNNIIVCGHTRVKAAKKLGMEEVPCIVADDLTDDQIKAFRLADNKTSELAEWDLDKLSEELKFIDMDMLQFGFEDLEAQLERDVLEDDFDDDEELPTTPYAKRGDIFKLGRHTLMCGDSTIEEDVKTLVGGEVMDMAFTDPPYNINYEGVAGKIINDKQNDESFYNFLFKAFTNMNEALKSGGTLYVCHSDTEGLNFRLALKNAGFRVAECIVWVKSSLVLGRQDYHWRHEPILYGWKEGASHYFIDDRTQDTVWEYDKPTVSKLHPTMKPLELIGRALKNSSRKNDKIIDLFGGSGSTMIACEQIDRTSYLMELDEKYVDVIVKRYLRYIQGYENCYLIRNGTKTPLESIADYSIDFNEEE